jgi:hypothetical protein
MMEGGENTTCGTCELQHKASGGEGICYVNKMYVNGVFDAWKRGKYPQFDIRKHSHHFVGRTIRWGAYGDPAMAPAKAFARIFKLARGWTGYSHQWRDEYSQDWKPYVMASVETPEGMVGAKAAGWRTFRIRRADEALTTRERKCPASAEGGGQITCDRCQACDGAARGGNLADISIIVHGKAGNAVRFTRLSISGRFATPKLKLETSRC